MGGVGWSMLLARLADIVKDVTGGQSGRVTDWLEVCRGVRSRQILFPFPVRRPGSWDVEAAEGERIMTVDAC